ncbi:MAG: ferritin-like domain-containing protein [Tepidanaerobacteraceae bacterium]|nr:ferritin-like domain-containing protein [Tepidanaerobacteraceae bacterium]
MQLTQKEKLQLQDAISHEKICIMKYNNYANQVQDAEIASMLRNLANREQQHADTLTKLLQQGGVQTVQQL